MSLASILRLVGNRLRRAAKPHQSCKASPRRPSFKPHVEQLEAREVPTVGVGVNLGIVGEGSTAWMFTDAFRQSSPWMSYAFNTVTGAEIADGGLVSVDARGYPTQLRTSVNPLGQPLQQRLYASMFTNGHEPTGVYTAEWQGNGQVTWYGDVTAIREGVRPNGTHFAELTVPQARTGIGMGLLSMDSANPIRAVHVWMPDYQGQSFVGQVWQPGASFSPFHPLFVERLRPLHTLRFIGMQDIDMVHRWADRRDVNFVTQVSGLNNVQGQSTGGNSATTLIDSNQNWLPNQWVGHMVRITEGLGVNQVHPIVSNSANQLVIDTSWVVPGDSNTGLTAAVVPDNTSTYMIQSGPGVSLEYIVALTNEVHADPWFAMPHLADDNFVRQFAAQVRDTLAPGLRVYVEFDNELWNSAPSFDGYQWVRQQLALPENAGVTHEQFVARQYQRIFDIWTQVFAGQTDRLVRAVSGNEEQPDYTRALLAHMNGNFDAISIGAYFNPLEQERYLNRAPTANQVLNDLVRSINSTEPGSTMANLRAHRTMTNDYTRDLGRRIQLLAYEGGPHLMPDLVGPGVSAQVQRAYFDAAHSPRMHGIEQMILRRANEVGFDLFLAEEYPDGTDERPSPGGAWGVLRHQDQPLAQAHRYRALLDFMAGTSTTLSSDAATAVAGQSVTLTARVTANALRPEAMTGSVNFYDSGRLLASAPVVNGAATLRTSALGLGRHALRAVYSGAGSYNVSVGALTQTVNRASTQATLTSSAANAVFGQPITLTMQVAAAAPGSGTPTGSVTFRDGASVLRTVRLGNGTATFTTSALGVRAHAITAVYSGDRNFQRTTASLTQTVNPAPTSTTLASSLHPARIGDVIIFRATVRADSASSRMPTGFVTFRNGDQVLGRVAVNASGSAQLRIPARSGRSWQWSPSLAAGSHQLTAIFTNSAGRFVGSMSLPLIQEVIQSELIAL